MKIWDYVTYRNDFMRGGFCGLVLSATFILALMLGLRSAQADQVFAAAAVKAAPGLQCRLYPEGGSATDGLQVATDYDGYARFNAVRQPPGAKAQILACKDAANKTTTYPVDLSAAGIFDPHPLDLAAIPGSERPALSGNPLGYTQLQLIKEGYGLRPDAAKDPSAYAQWLAAAQLHGRILDVKNPDSHRHTVFSSPGSNWVGSVLTGAPKYISTTATFNVPTVTPGADGTGITKISVWNGLAGNGTGSGLIQGGLGIYTTATTNQYWTWREYCCGDSDSNGYGGNFIPKAGDQLFSQAWYCDANGAVNINGGYGCTFLQDKTTGAVFNCTQANGTPCWSVKAYPLCSTNPGTAGCMTLGGSADFIIEDEETAPVGYPVFSPKITMAASAVSASSSPATISSDPSTSVLTGFGKNNTFMVVTLGSANQTYFAVEPFDQPYPLYCQGPLTTTPRDTPPTPSTPFKWASTGAGAAAPGPGKCAWADRGPRGSEIKSDNSNVLFGYLNQFANLAAGKYMEIGVYRDPGLDDKLVVTQIVGGPTPPFSAQPKLP